MRLKNKDLGISLIVFIAALVLRLINIDSYLFFGFEQGRDAQIIESIYKFQDFVLVGPSTSIGGLFHGAWYYYILAIPYGLSSGSPLAAIIFLILLGSLVPVVIYFLAKEIFNSRFWGVVAGVIGIFSYEYILYSRWLSNVSPAPLFIALAFLMLWKYAKSKSSIFFLGFVFFACIATSFQMILLAQFIFVTVLLFLLRFVKLPKIKTLTLSFFIAIAVFSPQIIFDFRNQHITFNSLFNYGGDSGPKNISSLIGSFNIYFTQIRNHLSLSTIDISFLWSEIFILVFILLGSFLHYQQYKKRSVLIFLYSWGFMSLPLIWISPGNPQYYVGGGLAWTLLYCLAIKSFWENKKLRMIAVLGSLIFFVGVIFTIYNLSINKNVFFRTFQDDLNYKDQKAILNFIHQDSSNKPYRLVAFTIPSLHSEGWDYLHKHLYPEDKEANAKIIYIVIEKYVFPVWEEKWINDLGKTKLIFEKEIGLLRLQKRELID